VRNLFIALNMFLLPSAGSHAACILPVPDGDGRSPSPANLHGRIEKVESGSVAIRPNAKAALVKVLLPKNAEIYSAFGGDVKVEELSAGQYVWVWYVGCKPPSKGAPVSAYFQVFSRDPHDHP
jgi:hypothetical protein